MLRDDLEEIQRKRKMCYEMLKQYLDIMIYKKVMTYIDYLNMEYLKKEIELLNIQGKKIVKKISENNYNVI